MSQPAPHTPAPDPLIDEIRQYRADLDQRFAGDWTAYGTFIRQTAAHIRQEFSLRDVTESTGVQPPNSSG